MAARDQNLQLMRIYVALVTFLCAVFLIGWIWAGVSSSTRTKQMVEAQSRTLSSEQQYKTLLTQLQLVRGMLGSEQFTAAEFEDLKVQTVADPKVEEMQNLFIQDMQLFGPNVPAQDRNYSKLVAYLLQQLRERNQQVDIASTRQDDLIAENKAVLKRETEAAQKEKDRANELEKQLAAERSDFTTKIEASVKTNDEVNKQLQTSNAAHAAEKGKLTGQIVSLQSESSELRTRNSQLAEKINMLEGEEFQAPQGKITGVSLDGRTAYVNLGRRDNLQTGVKFGIITPDQVKMSTAVPKAQIEIIEVSETQSRARVVSDNNSEPIVRGDLIYSPAWQSGRVVHFALLGKMDINDDGADDREIVKDLIRQSGGEIDEELTAEGKSFGKMNYDTKYMVRGEKFDPNSQAQAGEFASKFADMEKRAAGMGVNEINLDKLLTWLRSSSEDSSIPFGAATRASDFQVRDSKYLRDSGNPVSDVYQNPPRNP